MDKNIEPSVREALIKLKLVAHLDKTETSHLEKAQAFFLEFAAQAKDLDHFQLLIDNFERGKDREISFLFDEIAALEDDVEALNVGRKHLDLVTNPGYIMNR